MSVVIDASIILAAVIPSEVSHDVANRALVAWSSRGTTLSAPPLIYAEITAVLRKLSSTGRITQPDAEVLLTTIFALPIQILYNTDVYSEALILAHRYNLVRAYDTQYLAVAEQVNGTLWTADRKFVQSVRLTHVRHIDDFDAP
jgi:predicted nucleic acid-binding protein